MLVTLLTTVIYRAFSGCIHERSCSFWYVDMAFNVPMGSAEGQWGGPLEGALWLCGAGLL